MSFDLYRVKILERAQGSLYEASRPDILLDLIESKPRHEIRKGTFWVIENVSRVDKTALFFRLGRSAKSRLPKLTAAGFAEVSEETYPNTEVILDFELGVCGIRPKAELADSSVTIGHQFGRLLEYSDQLNVLNARVEVDPIKDPESFLDLVHSVYSLQKFEFDVTPPNPIDADRLFVEPFKKLVSEAQGAKGQVKIENKSGSLDRELIEEVTRSVASSGDDARIQFRRTEGETLERKSLHEATASFSSEDEGADNWLDLLVARMRLRYRQIRSRHDVD